MALGIVDPDFLKTDEVYLQDVSYEMFKDKTTKLFKKNKYLVFWTEYYCIFDRKLEITQEVFPIASLPWFIDTIENKYWAPSSLGSRRVGDLSETGIINGEEIGISYVQHCCAENLPGYVFWNKSRVSHISQVAPQVRDIPKFLLEQSLLNDFKRISTELNIKKYD